LRELEQRYEQDLVVIGVESGKFTAERVTQRIRDAANRLGNSHPIVNDRQFRVWRSYAVSAWPTLVVVDAAGMVVGSHAGEFTAEAVAPFLDELIARQSATGALRRGVTHFDADPPLTTPGRLRYPGKVALDSRSERLAVADSGHHQVLIGRLSASGTALRVERVVGDGPGFSDGESGRFRNPQGLTFGGDVLYVADEGNHAIRAIHLANGELRTVAGTGQQLRTRQDERGGALSSPWDVAMVDGRLVIAMAGTHALYTLDPSRGGRAERLAGGSREDLVDGPAAAAALAQPMGLATDGNGVLFVDAESSAVRRLMPVSGGEVTTVVGTGLFDFGDMDGVADEARLQHVQGVAVGRDGRVVVADSYNDALKWIDPASRRATTWVRGFGEPSGVALGERFAYVADTNAHRIATVALDSATIGTLAIED